MASANSTPANTSTTNVNTYQQDVTLPLSSTSKGKLSHVEGGRKKGHTKKMLLFSSTGRKKKPSTDDDSDDVLAMDQYALSNEAKHKQKLSLAGKIAVTARRDETYSKSNPNSANKNSVLSRMILTKKGKQAKSPTTRQGTT